MRARTVISGIVCCAAVWSGRVAAQSTCGNGDSGCPFGYSCAAGTCVPPASGACDPGNPNTCSSGQACTCLAATDPGTCACLLACDPACASGTICNTATHLCDPSPGAPPDLAGIWSTAHSFDIGQALPPALRGAMGSLATLDQDLVRALEKRAALRRLHEQVVAAVARSAPSLLTIKRIGDAIGAILATLRSEGSMSLSPGDGPGRLQATEGWDKLVFAWSPLCGQLVTGGPNLAPGCDRFDVPAAGVSVAPADAVVQWTGRWELQFARREVSTEPGDLPLHVVDALLARTTSWKSLREATACAPGESCLIDCSALAKEVEALAPGAGGFAGATCRRTVREAGSDAREALRDADFGSSQLVFDGAASVSTGGDRLGQDDYDARLQKDPAHRDGAWNGTFLSEDLRQQGAWEARRAAKQAP